MANEIKCPHCGHHFEPGDAIRDEVEKELRSKAAEWQKKKSEEYQLKLEDEKKRIIQTLEEETRKRISNDFEIKMRALEDLNKDNEEKLKLARQEQVAFMKKEQDLITKEAEIEISIQKQLQEEREKLSVDIRKQEEQRISLIETEHKLREKEWAEKFEAQRKLVDEMKRKAEQGSTQSQGEAQELVLEDMLRNTFPFDIIQEVGKGVKGADSIQTVRNNFGQECGRIIYESKRTQSFSLDWIEKLKADMRSTGADIAILVTSVMPRDMNGFGEKNGVWICTFSEVKPIVHMLRDSIIRISTAVKSQENRGEKMHMLYEYLTSREFAAQWGAIREGFLGMRQSIQKERDAMEKLWKQREKQLDKILLNAAHFRGSIEGIAGMDVDLHLLEDGTTEEEPS